jgi:hypothetical protein
VLRHQWETFYINLTGLKWSFLSFFEGGDSMTFVSVKLVHTIKTDKMEVITLVLGLLLSNLSASATGTPETQSAQAAEQQQSAEFIIYEDTHP